MKKLLLLLGLAALCLGCFDNPKPDAGSANTNTNIINIFGPSAPSASPSPSGCLTILRVGVIASDPATGADVTSFPVGTTVRLDATPHGQGDVKVPLECAPATVLWNISGPCTLGGATTSYTPVLQGTSAGVCVASATVGNVAGSLTISVQ